MTMHRCAVALALALALSLGAAACGDDSGSAGQTRTVDDAAVESGIDQQLSTSSTKVTDAKCPSDVESEKGATFTCTVTWSNDASGKVKVTQTGANQFSYEPVSGSVQIPGATVEKDLQEQLAAEGAPNAVVNCPDNIIVKLDTTVTCDVSGGGGKVGGSVTFSFSSAEGDIDDSSVSSG